MQKTELIQLYAEATGQPATTAAEHLNRLGDIIAAELLGDGKVPLPNVGKLLVVSRAPRTARNPKNGAVIDVPARKVAKLAMSKEFKEALR